jgi:hypothetical protein
MLDGEMMEDSVVVAMAIETMGATLVEGEAMVIVMAATAREEVEATAAHERTL